MHYIAIGDTDKGIIKKTNQDSLLIKHGKTEKGEILLAIVCDGMGGLDKGELASATVIRAFSDWFDNSLPYELESLDLKVIAGKWELLLKDLNLKILDYGKLHNIKLGTTFTGILFFDKEFVSLHVGDSRLYYIGDGVNQLTKDHTFVEREIEKGNLSKEEAKKDKRRNLLLQCVGASAKIEPQLIMGQVKKGAYMLCSDGFRHEISDEEIFNSLNPKKLDEPETMQNKVRFLINQVKSRGERDNISAILVKAE